jgi:hypothetical protein
MEGGVVGHNFQRGPPKDHPSQICFSGFRGEDLNVKVYKVLLTDRWKPSDGPERY